MSLRNIKLISSKTIVEIIIHAQINQVIFKRYNFNRFGA